MEPLLLKKCELTSLLPSRSDTGIVVIAVVPSFLTLSVEFTDTPLFQTSLTEKSTERISRPTIPSDTLMPVRSRLTL